MADHRIDGGNAQGVQNCPQSSYGGPPDVYALSSVLELDAAHREIIASSPPPATKTPRHAMPAGRRRQTDDLPVACDEKMG